MQLTLRLTLMSHNIQCGSLHLPLPYVRASQAERAVSTVGKSSKDFPLPIFPALMASTKRDASCARQDPFSVWVCERHFRSDKQLHRSWCVPASLFRVNCRGAASSTSSIRSPMMSAATSAWRSPDSHRGIQCWYTISLRFEPSVELVGEPAHKNTFSYLEPVALCGTFETNRVVLQKYLMAKWWMCDMMFNYLTPCYCVNLPINMPFIIVPIFLQLRAPWVINVLS